MRFFFKKSISKFKNNNGEKKESFEIIKGNDKFIHQIKATSADRNTFNIQEHIIKKNNGFIKQKTYKIKASHINNILKESKNSIVNNKKDIIDVLENKDTLSKKERKITVINKKDIIDVPENKDTLSKKERKITVINKKEKKPKKITKVENKDTIVNKKEKKSKIDNKEKKSKKIISKVENKVHKKEKKIVKNIEK